MKHGHLPQRVQFDRRPGLPFAGNHREERELRVLKGDVQTHGGTCVLRAKERQFSSVEPHYVLPFGEKREGVALRGGICHAVCVTAPCGFVVPSDVGERQHRLC
ncbi:hypothetical protein THTE_1928 [Thermogutta terrifontis]|uniref:Uncharacterized protein n=1 Tax=Thermogutta terrifontis TaxID=1331910 RepID=A0A286REY9_9BACT|nr:hypothetical protein THTE_1928 [Thermogutta terrifontis]